jgi:hypothetical protein
VRPANKFSTFIAEGCNTWRRDRKVGSVPALVALPGVCRH